MLRTNKEGQELIKKYESLRLDAYHCSAGVCTIGWGSTSYQDGSPIKEEDRISEETAQDLFEYHINKCEEKISSLIMIPVTDNQFSAMVCLCYNIGTSAFSKSTLLKMLNNGEQKESVAYEFSKWNRVNGKVLNGLVNRRRSEMELFLK